MTRPAPLATAGARRISLDRFAIGLLVVAVATVVGGLLWAVAGGGAVSRVVFIGGAALATVPLTLRQVVRWGTPGTSVGGGLLGAIFVPSLLAAIVSGITIAIALATPAGQAFLRVEQVDAQSWLFGAEGVARQIAITSALPLFGGAGVALTALVVVGLPWLALRRPAVAATGSRIEGTGARRAPRITRLVFVGLAPLLVGIALWVGADESLLRFPFSLGWVLDALARGRAPSWNDLGHVLGVLLVAVGAASVGTGMVLTALQRPAQER